MRCKAGDDAYIIYSEFVENIGKRVHITELVLSSYNGKEMWCLTTKNPLWRRSLANNTVALSSDPTYAFDQQLLPIRDTPPSLTVKTDTFYPRELEST